MFVLFRDYNNSKYILQAKYWEKLGLLDLCELAVQQQDNLDNSLLLRQYEEGEDQMHDDEELRIHLSMKYFQ